METTSSIWERKKRVDKTKHNSANANKQVANRRFYNFDSYPLPFSLIAMVRA